MLKVRKIVIPRKPCFRVSTMRSRLVSFTFHFRAHATEHYTLFSVYVCVCVLAAANHRIVFLPRVFQSHFNQQGGSTSFSNFKPCVHVIRQCFDSSRASYFDFYSCSDLIWMVLVILCAVFNFVKPFER